MAKEPTQRTTVFLPLYLHQLVSLYATVQSIKNHSTESMTDAIRNSIEDTLMNDEEFVKAVEKNPIFKPLYERLQNDYKKRVNKNT